MTRSQILDQKIRTIAQSERTALAELVVDLRELDSIRGYIELGFRSLFEYLTEGVGYSGGAAQRRIDATRLSRDVPDLSERLESGHIDLHHVTSVSKAIRQGDKKRKITREEKREIVAKIEKQTEAQTQKTVAEFFDLELITRTKRSVQKDGSVRYEITVSREVAELIEQAQALVSHAVPTSSLADFLEHVSRKIIKQKTQPARGKKSKVMTDETKFAQTAATVAVANDERVSEGTHRKVRARQPRCAHCGSPWFPQTDHRRSRWAGGGNEEENLQTLCGPCNRAKYHREVREYS